jgi:hypothetical protein
MANYIKQEERRAELQRMIDAGGLAPRRYPMPKCASGADALVASDQRGGTVYFCREHTPPDIRKMFQNSPLYAGRNPFA